MKGCWILSNAFSVSNVMIMWLLFFETVYVVDYFGGLPYIEPSLNPWDKPYLIMVNDHFDVFLDLVCKNFIEFFFALIFISKNVLKFSFFVESLCV